MRKLSDHIVSGYQAVQLTISVLDEPGAGGANHAYAVEGFDAFDNPSHERAESQTGGPTRLMVLFQNGPIKEAGVNGITQEALLAIVIDRLRSFQAGPFACPENGTALEYSQLALGALQMRTRKRLARGVEGTHQK